MNKFKETIDKIELDENEKNKMLNNIMNNQKEEKIYGYKSFVMKFAMFIFVFLLLSGSCYALVKIFKFDKKFTSWFDVTDEELDDYGLTGEDVNVTKEFDDAIITINQTVYDEKEIYLMVEVKGKTNPVFLSKAYLSKGEKFDENVISDEQSYLQGEIDLDEYSKRVIFGSLGSGFGLIDEAEDHNGYALTFSISKELNDVEPVTLRLTDEDKFYDISFKLKKNEIKTKKVEVNKVVYNENELEVKIKEIRLTPFRAIIDLEYNKDPNLLTDAEMAEIQSKIFNEGGGEKAYVTFKDGTRNILSFFGPTRKTADASFGESTAELKNIDDIESLTLNDIKFEIK